MYDDIQAGGITRGRLQTDGPAARCYGESGPARLVQKDGRARGQGHHGIERPLGGAKSMPLVYVGSDVSRPETFCISMRPGKEH